MPSLPRISMLGSGGPGARWRPSVQTASHWAQPGLSWACICSGYAHVALDGEAAPSQATQLSTNSAKVMVGASNHGSCVVQDSPRGWDACLPRSSGCDGLESSSRCRPGDDEVLC